MTIENKFEFKDIVILKTDIEKLKRMVIRISVSVNMTMLYELACADKASWHYDFEIEKVNGDTNAKKVGY